MRRRAGRTVTALVGLASIPVLFAAACGDDGGDPGFEEGQLVAIEEVAEADVDVAVRVRGPVFLVDGTTRICSAILESFPPQCGEPSLVVEGWDIDSDERAQTEGGVTWVEDVELAGRVQDGVLVAAAG
jgi:hypothetical protein